uniref:(northern house mosquito) hypothetical protein n=1 Tax=Culex pipiens TaxID=7175 RepID=A0A8D8HZN6_CULPI
MTSTPHRPPTPRSDPLRWWPPFGDITPSELTANRPTSSSPSSCRRNRETGETSAFCPPFGPSSRWPPGSSPDRKGCCGTCESKSITATRNARPRTVHSARLTFFSSANQTCSSVPSAIT